MLEVSVYCIVNFGFRNFYVHQVPINNPIEVCTIKVNPSILKQPIAVIEANSVRKGKNWGNYFSPRESHTFTCNYYLSITRVRIRVKNKIKSRSPNIVIPSCAITNNQKPNTPIVVPSIIIILPLYMSCVYHCKRIAPISITILRKVYLVIYLYVATKTRNRHRGYKSALSNKAPSQ